MMMCAGKLKLLFERLCMSERVLMERKNDELGLNQVRFC